MKIAITGANGFLGSHLVKAFLNAGFEVIALVREGAITDLLPRHQALCIHVIDYTSSNSISNSLREIIEEYGFVDYFLHNAGLTVSSKKENYFKVNSTLTHNILKSIKLTNAPIGNFIYISSYAAQGPVGFDSPVSNYGRSKAEAENVLSESGLKHVIIRPTAIYGKGDMVFLPLFKIASKGFYPLTSSKHQKLTFIYVKDLSNAVLENRDENGVIHVSNEEVYLHEDVITTFEEITGKKIFRISIPPFLAKSGLLIADLFSRAFGINVSMTLEKFNEISKDWNCNQNPSLKHAKIANQLSLKEGFEKTMNYYKENQLIK